MERTLCLENERTLRETCIMSFFLSLLSMRKLEPKITLFIECFRALQCEKHSKSTFFGNLFSFTHIDCSSMRQIGLGT